MIFNKHLFSRYLSKLLKTRNYAQIFPRTRITIRTTNVWNRKPQVLQWTISQNPRWLPLQWACLLHSHHVVMQTQGFHFSSNSNNRIGASYGQLMCIIQPLEVSGGDRVNCYLMHYLILNLWPLLNQSMKPVLLSIKIDNKQNWINWTINYLSPYHIILDLQWQWSGFSGKII